MVIEAVVWRGRVHVTAGGYSAEFWRDGLEHEPFEYEVCPRTLSTPPAMLFALMHLRDIVRAHDTRLRIREFQRGLRRKT